MQDLDREPLPVPEHEALQWSGERLELTGAGLILAMRLARLGEDDALVAYVGADRKVWSRRIRNAFSTWPPEVGEAVSHPHGGFNMDPVGLAGWADGSFSINTSAGWIFAMAGEPGTRCALPQPGFPDAAGGVYTFSEDGGEKRLVYRAKRTAESHVRHVGALLGKVETRAGCVTEGGRLMLPVWQDVAAPAQNKEGVLQIVIAEHGKMEVGAKLVCAPPFRVWGVPRLAGGLYLALDRRATVDVHTVGEDGRVVGRPWIQRNVSSTDHVAAFTRWRDGFALCTTRDKSGYAVTVSDGVHATFGRGAVREDFPLFDFMGLASSPDGKVILFVGPTRSNPVLLRMVCGPGGARAPFIPERIERSAAPRTPSRAPLETRETVLLNIRQRAVLAAFASLRYPQPSWFEGNGRAGVYAGSNEQGANFAVHWDATGLVALGLENTNPESEAILEAEDRRPGKYLVGLPKEMRPLALRAIAFGDRLATEGLWIADSGDMHGRAGQAEVLEQLARFDPGEVWLGGGNELSVLAGRLAALDRHTLTSDEEALLFDSVTLDDGELELGRVEEVVAALATLGVEWQDAVVHASGRGAIRVVERPPLPLADAEPFEPPGPAITLEERAEPPPVAEPLTVVPPLDTTRSAPEVSALLERAEELLPTDGVAALNALLAAWRLNRNPRLGNLAEKLASSIRAGQPDYFVRQPGGRPDFVATERALRAGLDAPAEPTTTRAILGWLWEGWAASSPSGEDAAAELLIHTRDGRFVESLEQHCALGRPGSSKPVCASLKAAFAALKALVPGTLDERDIVRVGCMEDVLAGRPKQSAGIATRDLFMAIYENPDDDAPRRELATRLEDAGDPRGEFISLQLSRHASGQAPTPREAQLVAAHGRKWMGEIERILGAEFTFERGFLVSATTREGRGGMRAISPPILTTGGGTQLEWSTVRRLDLWPHAYGRTFGLLRGSRIRGLAEVIHVSEVDLSDLLHGPPRKLERLEIAYRRTELDFRGLQRHLERLPEKLPELRSVALAAPGGDLGILRPTLARLPMLRELSVRLAHPSLDELAAAGRELGLTAVTSLGRIEFTHSLDTETLTIAFPYVFDETYGGRVAEALSRMDARVRQIVIEVPARARLVGEGTGAAMIERDWDSMPLAPILASAEALGVPFQVARTRDERRIAPTS